MEKVGVDLPSEIEGDNVGIAAMIDESSLVAIEHAIKAQWEKLVKVGVGLKDQRSQMKKS